MSLTVEKNGFISLQALIADLSNELMAAGFTLSKGYKMSSGVLDKNSATTTVDEDIGQVFLSPDNTIDPAFDTQPWMLVLTPDDTNETLGVHMLTPTQVLTDDGPWTIAQSNTNQESGRLSRGNSTNESFVSLRGTKDKDWFGANGADAEASPMSYRVSVGNHGMVFAMWSESFDRDGDKFAWFCVQRPVSKDGVPLNSPTSKNPLFCVFSQNGGGTKDVDASGTGQNAIEKVDGVNTVSADGILKFVVREADVNAPTRPVSAVQPSADSSAIINPIQQVAIGEDNQYVVNFPQGLNTHRFLYPHELDMIAFTSADVVSQYTELAIRMYGEDADRKYKAINANSPNNKGMRLLVVVEGAGVA